MRKLPTYLLIVFFTGMLFFPWINGTFNFIPDVKNTENRVLAELPQLEISYLDPFPKDYELYLNDHFNLRNLLIQTRNSFNYEIFNQTSPNSTVEKGKDGYLFLKDDLFYGYRNMRYMSDESLDNIVKELARRQRWCEERGIEFLLVIVPRKFSIYPDKTPDNYVKQFPFSDRERLIMRLDELKSVDYLDLTPALLNAKSEHAIFHKLDMHWTDYGAFLAYREIMKELKKKVAIENKLLELSDYEMVSEVNEMISMIDAFNLLSPPEEDQYFLIPEFVSTVKDGVKSNYIPPGNFGYVSEYEIVKLNPSVRGPRAFIIRDSFGRNLIPFLTEGFSRSTYIWDGWKYNLHEKKIEKEHPDVVMLIMQETGIQNISYYPE